jgi:hypothetical protein
MPGKNFQMTPLESRKQLLLVESELNRAQLLNELRDFKSKILQLEDQMQVIGSLASSAVTLASTFSTIGNALTHRNGEDGKSKSWISTLLNGARTGVSIWSALRSHQK